GLWDGATDVARGAIDGIDDFLGHLTGKDAGTETLGQQQNGQSEQGILVHETVHLPSEAGMQMELPTNTGIVPPWLNGTTSEPPTSTSEHPQQFGEMGWESMLRGFEGDHDMHQFQHML